MTLTVRHVLTEHVPALLPRVVPFIERGMAYATTYNTEHVKVYLADGKWMLLVATNEADEICGAYVLAYHNEPDARVAFIVCAAGRGLAGQGAFDQVCTIARTFGATKVQALARNTAARLYKRVGFLDKAMLMEKKL